MPKDKYFAKMEGAMTVRELIDSLAMENPDAKVSIFANGESYPALKVQNMKEILNSDEVEIGGGWQELPEP